MSALDAIRRAMAALKEAEAALLPVEPPQTPQLQSQRLDLSRIVCFASWHYASRYERFQKLQLLDGDTVSLTLVSINLSNGGQRQPFLGGRYSVLIDGVEAGSVVVNGQTEIQLTAKVSGLSDGWHELTIGGLTGAENCPKWFGLRGSAQNMPVVTGSYDVVKLTGGVHYWAWVTPGKPEPRPLPKRPYPVSDGLSIAMQQLIPGNGHGNTFRPVKTADGRWSTFNKQPYEWQDLHAQMPTVPLLDGPRGVGTCAFVTHIGVGTATQTADPNSAPRLNIYATDSWRLMRVSDDGAITTLLGYRHKDNVPTYWRDPQQVELVGDWSAIPEARRGCRELWGMAFAPESLRVDTSAPPIPTEDNRQPHVSGPVCVLSDSYNNRVLRGEFQAARHGPPKVTELIKAEDPWDVVDWAGHWIVSERGSDRVCQYDRSGKLVRVIVERDPNNAAAAITNQTIRKSYLSSGTLAMARLQPCLRPEGLYVLDDWLYIGSRVQAMVSRVHLITGERQTVALLPIESDTNAHFVKIAVSDGTFGPKGALWVQTWSNARAAYSGYYLNGAWVQAPQHDARLTGGYGTAVACGGGRLYIASMHEGIQRWSARQPEDPKAMDGILFQQGLDEYHRKGLHLLYGHNGISPHGYKLPGDLSPAVRRYVDVSLS